MSDFFQQVFLEFKVCFSLIPRDVAPSRGAVELALCFFFAFRISDPFLKLDIELLLFFPFAFLFLS